MANVTTTQLIQRLKNKMDDLLDSHTDRTDEIKNLSEALSNLMWAKHDENRKEAK